ncbi:MAG: hypothetical protein ACRBK7_22635 [Acidimicrobiales bacterium]
MRRVEAPDAYWAQVINSALTDDRISFNQYRLVEHPYVEQWWGHHWDLAERLLDDPAYNHIRFNFFDAEDIAYRYAVTAVENDTGAVALVEFRLVD